MFPRCSCHSDKGSTRSQTALGRGGPRPPSPLIVKRQGKLHHEGGRPGPATPAREAVTPLSVGRVAAMAVETVEQQAPNVIL